MDFNEIKQLEKNFRDHNYSYFINTKIESAHSILYTNPLGVFDDHPVRPVDIEGRLVDEIGKGECRSFVVFGDSGSGKTSLALHLCNEYWKKISNKSDAEVREIHYIPIYISLRQIELQKDCKNILSNFYEKLCNWNLLLFLDGYDELEEKINLWDHNNWWLPERSKRIKTVTFCKTIGVTVSEREECFTFGDSEKSKFINLQAFETPQIEDYVQRTVTFLKNLSLDDEDLQNDPWMMTKKVTLQYVVWENITAEYQKWVGSTFPDLKKLAGNPYLLTVILQILPGIVEECKQSANSLDVSEQERVIRIRCSTEIGIYDEFVAQWFKYQATKNRKNKSNPDFLDIPMRHHTEFMKSYAQNLAFTLVQKNGGFLGDGSVTETESNLWYLWKPIHNNELLDLADTEAKYSKLFPKNDNDNDDRRFSNLRSLRSVCFLSNPEIGKFKFFHSSLVEYLASREVFENIRGRFNFYLNSDDPIYDNEFGINSTDLNDPDYRPLLRNLAQRAQTNEPFKELLFEIISTSTEILILSRMSANAITILNFAGISLSGRNFRNVQIANANLSGANSANSDFQFANLAGANLQQSWMVGCRFQGANLDKVEFGQNVSVILDDCVVGMVPYVKDGESKLVIRYVSGKIDMYNYSSEVLCELQCQTVGRHRLYIVGNALLSHTFCNDEEYRYPALTKFISIETTLLVNLWSLNCNEQMEAIFATNPRPELLPAKYWISEKLLELARDKTLLEMASDPCTGTEVFHNEPFTSTSTLKASRDVLLNRNNVNDEIFFDKVRAKESFYYYEIKLCQKSGIGLVVVWGYIFQNMEIVQYRYPQILDSFEIPTDPDYKETLFRFYSDFPIFSFAVCMNKLLAIKGQNFVMIFSILSTTNIFCKENVQKDSEDYANHYIKFSSNGKYLIYKSDFVYLCIINKEKVESIVQLLEVEKNDVTNLFVVFDRSCEMAAFSYDKTIFICKLPTGTVIQKIYTPSGLLFSLFPTFAFIDGKAKDTRKLFSYESSKNKINSLETIVVSETMEPISHRTVKDLGVFCVSNDNTRVAAFYTISEQLDTTKKYIISVYNTPIRSESFQFQKTIQSQIYTMMFTPNYLLVVMESKLLVLDMKGNFFQSIPLDSYIDTFISSKYQKIVLCSEKTGKPALQLCSIVETVTGDQQGSPIAFKNQNFCNLNISVARLLFDSKEGSYILLKNLWDDENVWLWVPSSNVCTKISQPPSFFNLDSFYMMDAEKICVSDSFGYYFANISPNNSIKTEKIKYYLRHDDYKKIKSKFYLNVHWYICGDKNGKLYIYYLKSGNFLTEFLFPHPVEDFNFFFKYNSSGDVLQSVDVLTWDFDDNISSLVIEDMNYMVTDAPTANIFLVWKLKWTIKSNFPLNFQNSVIAKTYNITKNNIKLLSNLNVNLDFGEPWPEEINYFSLSELYMPITEMHTKFAIINTHDSSGPRMPIMADQWVVSALARNLNSDSNTVRIEHVGLLIEGINNGRHFAMEAHLTANKKKGYVRIKLFPISTRKRLDELETDYIVQQWSRHKSYVQKLICSIQNDQICNRKYNFLRNNCATWCMEKLKEIRVETDRKKWYSKIFLCDPPSDLFLIKDRIVKNRLTVKGKVRSVS